MRVLATVAACALLVACSSSEKCTESVPAHCADLEFQGTGYDEWREANAPRILEEIGNARYPACNAGPCTEDPFNGFQATDVWNVRGVDNKQAVLGLRQNTHTYVVFVAQGVDPDELLPLINPKLLR